MPQIDRIRAVPPTANSDCEAALAVHLDEGPEPRFLVEYVSGGGGRHASVSHARKVVQRYLDDPSAPRRFIVDREGTARPREG